MRSPRGVALVLVLAGLATIGGALSGCGPTVRQTAATTVSTAGAVLAAMQAEHQRVYLDATDSLRARLRAQGGSLADYEREVAPVNLAFHRRGEAIQTLDASLYAAAAIIDSNGDHERDTQAARDVLDALRRAVAVLRDGAVMPAVTVPARVDEVIQVLETVIATEASHG